MVSYYCCPNSTMLGLPPGQIGHAHAPPATHRSSALQPLCDVTIIGSGLAGKAAASQLAQAGLKVICIESADSVRQPVGESLDWSAPELLKVLGLPMEELIERRIATWKKHVTVKLRDGSSEHYVPTPWLAGAPFHIELRTLHVDRVLLDQELLKIALEHGVTLVCDKVVRVERNGKKISAVHTASGREFSSPWFIDASGFGSCLLAREFALRSIQFGPAKVAMWTYFPQPELVEGTTLYFDPVPSEYLDWIWEIPISSEVVSVGYITTGTAMKAKREQGLSVEEIFQQQVSRFAHFEELAQRGVRKPLNVTSFRSRVFAETAGPNWFITGKPPRWSIP